MRKLLFQICYEHTALARFDNNINELVNMYFAISHRCDAPLYVYISIDGLQKFSVILVFLAVTPVI